MNIALILFFLCMAILLVILFRPRRSRYIRRVTSNRNGQPWYRDLENRSRPVICLTQLLFLLALMLANTGVVLAQDETTVPLRIRLRASDGSAVVAELLVLERLPDEEVVEPVCLTGTTGQCTWYVEPGLYQLLFTRPLDEISALAVAEGGLRGLGLTVGQTAVTYHFTFHSDDHVYFDAAPDATVPEPVIPAETHQHGPGAAVTPPVDSAETATSRPNSVAITTTEISAETTGQAWRPLVYIILGLLLGSGLHLLQRLRRPEKKAKKRPPTVIEGQWQVVEPGKEETD
jgi:hypothetical protein